MLYTIGTEAELPLVESKLPYEVFKALYKSTIVLDYAYGPNRNYRESGGYSLVAETPDDVEAMRKAVDYTIHPPEWTDRIENFLMSLFVLGNDYSIVLVMPLSIAPEGLLEELEEPV